MQIVVTTPTGNVGRHVGMLLLRAIRPLPRTIGFFFTNLLLQLDAVRAGVMSVVQPVDQPMAWVAPRDIAETAVVRLLSADWFRPTGPGSARPGRSQLAAGGRHR